MAFGFDGDVVVLKLGQEELSYSMVLKLNKVLNSELSYIQQYLGKALRA